MPTKHPSLHSAWLIGVILLVTLSIGYVFSYAPAVYLKGKLGYHSIIEDWPVYYPVDFAYDHITPMRNLLNAWADAWGVKQQFQFNSNLRAVPEYSKGYSFMRDVF